MLETIGHLGFMFHIFLVGVQVDVIMVKRVGRQAIATGIVGFLVPNLLSVFFYLVLGNLVPMDAETKAALPVVLSIGGVTSLPVVSGFLIDLKMLNSELGRLAIMATMICELCNWTLLIILNTLESKIGFIGPLLSIIAYLLVAVFIFRPLAFWIIRHTPEGKPIKEIYIFAILVLAIYCGLYGEVVGLHAGTGSLILGFVIPDGSPLGATLMNRADYFVTGLFIPIFYTVNGLKTYIPAINELGSSLFIEFIIVLGYIGKFLGTFLPSLYYGMPLGDALPLSLIMCCKGIIELAIFGIWKDHKHINNQAFSLLVISLVIGRGIITRLVPYLYDPSKRYMAYKRRSIFQSKENTELRMLACIHNQDEVPTLINLFHASNPKRQSSICIFVLHLVELVGSAASIIVSHNQMGHNHNSSNINPLSWEHIFNALKNFQHENEGNVMVEHFSAVAPYASIHDDICTLALDKRTAIIILPFHRKWTIDNTPEATFPAIRNVNLNVLEKSPCSVGILIDRDPISGHQSYLYRIAVLFLGGADDREALAYAKRMIDHPNITLTVVRFMALPGHDDDDDDDDGGCSEKEKKKAFDNQVINSFRIKMQGKENVFYKEEVVSDGDGTTQVVCSMANALDLVMVGRRHERCSPFTLGLKEWSEFPELGFIGDMLATSDFSFSVLVVQPQLDGVDPSNELEEDEVPITDWSM